MVRTTVSRLVLTPAGTAATVSDDEGLKTSWPEVMGWMPRSEVVGWMPLNAAFQISSDRPDLSTDFYSETTPLPSDYNPKCVIIISDKYRGVVVDTSVIG